MASLNATLGSIYGATSNAANSVGKVFAATGEGIDMLHRAISEASNAQNLRYVINRDNVEQRLIEESAEECSERQLRVDAFCNQSERHAQLFNSNYARIKALVDASKNRV